MKNSELWKNLECELEQSVGDIEAPSFESSSQVPSLDDQLARRLAAGTAPLYLLSLLAMALLGSAGHGFSLLFAPLLSLLFCWLLAPFVGSRQGVTFGKVLFCAPFVVGFTVVALLLPLQVSRSLSDSTNKLATVFVHDLQNAIEAVLQPTTLLFLVLGCLVCATAVRALMSKRPWLDPPRFHKGRMIAGSLLVAFGVVVPGFVVLTSPYSQPAQDWRNFTEQTLRETPSWGMPKQASDEVWGPVLEVIPDHRIKKSQILEACRTGRPRSRRALWSVARLLEQRLTLALPDWSDQDLAETALYLVEYNLIIRADHQAVASREAVKKFLLPRVLAPELEATELEKWKTSLHRVAGALPSDAVRELDYNAYEYIYGQSLTEIVITEDGGAPDRSGPSARPLKVFGREFSPSPTEIASRYEDGPLFEDWFKLRAELFDLSAKQRTAFFQKLRTTGARRSRYPNFDSHFIENLENRAYYQTLEPILSAAQAIVDLREYKLKNGDYPDTLTDLMTPEKAARWSLTRVADEWQLGDEMSEDSYWILP